MEVYFTRRKLVKILSKIVFVITSFYFLFKFLSFKSKKLTSKQIKIKKWILVKDGAVVYPKEKIAIVNINNTLFGLDLTCPHLGCTVNVTEKYIICPCHGSKFTHSGKYLSGPARKDLNKYKVVVKDDNIILRNL